MESSSPSHSYSYSYYQTPPPLPKTTTNSPENKIVRKRNPYTHFPPSSSSPPPAPRPISSSPLSAQKSHTMSSPLTSSIGLSSKFLPTFVPLPSSPSSPPPPPTMELVETICPLPCFTPLCPFLHPSPLFISSYLNSRSKNSKDLYPYVQPISVLKFCGAGGGEGEGGGWECPWMDCEFGHSWSGGCRFLTLPRDGTRYRRKKDPNLSEEEDGYGKEEGGGGYGGEYRIGGVQENDPVEKLSSQFRHTFLPSSIPSSSSPPKHLSLNPQQSQQSHQTSYEQELLLRWTNDYLTSLRLHSPPSSPSSPSPSPSSPSSPSYTYPPKPNPKKLSRTQDAIIQLIQAFREENQDFPSSSLEEGEGEMERRLEGVLETVRKGVWEGIVF